MNPIRLAILKAMTELSGEVKADDIISIIPTEFYERHNLTHHRIVTALYQMSLNGSYVGRKFPKSRHKTQFYWLKSPEKTKKYVENVLIYSMDNF